MSQPSNPAPKAPNSHLHVMNLIVALLAGVISITGGIYSLKNNVFSGPAYGSLQGVVRDEKIAKPLKLAAVEISDLAGAVVNTATTDDDGHYLIEALKTGNYVVKFTAPIHKVETKTIKIEKNLTSSINVDLVPEVQPVSVVPAESAAAQRNIQAPYAPTAPVVPGYNVPQNNAAVPATAPTYSRSEPAQDGSFSGTPPSGFHRYPHRRPPGGYDSTSSSGSSQSDALTQVGAQLLQALVTKKTEDNTSTTSSSN